MGQWFVDSKATAHICSDRSVFSNYVQHASQQSVLLGDNSELAIRGVGTVTLQLNNGSTLTLSNVLHVPLITKNLLSVSQLASNKETEVVFRKSLCTIKQWGRVIDVGTLLNDLFLLNVSSVPAPFAQVAGVHPSVTASDVTKIWHMRLRHPNLRKLKDMSKTEVSLMVCPAI